MIGQARGYRSLKLALAMSVVVSLVSMAPPASSAAESKPTVLGVVTQGQYQTDLQDFASEAGRYPAMYQLFWALDHAAYSWPNSWATPMLRALKNTGGTTAYVEITTSNLSALNNGQQDAYLNGMAKNVADFLKESPSNRILIAPLPEMNLAGHAWGGTPGAFKTAYARIRQAFLNQGVGKSQIRFVFAPLGVTDSSGLEDYYPGDQLVDIIGFSKFNKNNPWQDYHDAFQKHIDGLQRYVSRSKPILVSQTGSVTTGGNRDVWLDDMFTKLKADEQVIGAIYYSRIGDNDYRVLANGQLDNAFSNGYQGWSDPGQLSWVFDGRMDAWVQDRAVRFASRFSDTWGHTFEADIEWLADQGITAGCNPPANSRFCPDDYVTRGAMAAFLVRALGYNSNGGGNLFTDDNGHTFEADIDKLGTAGVTAGCNPPANSRFCPDDYVTRGAMAAFLHRALGG
jgi:hypothetical protein